MSDDYRIYNTTINAVPCLHKDLNLICGSPSERLELVNYGKVLKEDDLK